MKNLLVQYAAYNKWATQKIFDILNQLSEIQLHQEIVSSFPSVYKTVLHLMDAENIWWQRLKLAEHIERPSDNFSGSFEELQKKIMLQSQQWEDWVINANDHQLYHVFAYQNNKKEQFKQPVNEVLIHLFNHGTYHRGQLITMLRQIGIEKIPLTDFIDYCRDTK